MITAVDTSVLIAIAKSEISAAGWIALLAKNRREGDLVICEVAAAEYFSLVMDERLFSVTLTSLGLDFDAIRLEAALEAGRIFRSYRKTGGPREHLLPDFLIGAHALKQAHQLAADDRGYLRRYFPKLKVIRP